MPVSIANGLRIRGIDVLTAYEDGRHELDDPALLDRAVELNRVMFSRDDDLVIETASRLAMGSTSLGSSMYISSNHPSVQSSMNWS